MLCNANYGSNSYNCYLEKEKNSIFFWLMLMFYGASLFGLIDHLWNGELFLISKDWLKDLSLGIVITETILIAWKIILILAKNNFALDSQLISLEKKY